MRALLASPIESVAWLTENLDRFGDRLGAVLLRVPSNMRRRDDGSSEANLARLLTAWPARIPLVAELDHPSWDVDPVHGVLAEHGAVLCATDLPDAEAPTIRLTGPFLYLRLRRPDYDAVALSAWAARIEPFLGAGHDAFVFFRHDEVGRGAELAVALRSILEPEPGSSGAGRPPSGGPHSG